MGILKIISLILMISDGEPRPRTAEPDILIGVIIDILDALL